MDIEEEIVVAYLLIRRIRKKGGKRKPQNKSVGRIVLNLHYLSCCFIFLDITSVGFSLAFLFFCYLFQGNKMHV